MTSESPRAPAMGRAEPDRAAAQRGDAPAPADRDPRQVVLTSLGLLLATAACLAAFATDAQGPLRTVVALGFLLFVPGLALAELLPVRGLAQRLAIATGASLAIETLIAVALVYAGAYTSGLALSIVAGVTLATLVAALGRAVRERP